MSVTRSRAANGPVMSKATRRPRASSGQRKRSRSPGPGGRERLPAVHAQTQRARGVSSGANGPVGGTKDDEQAGEWGFSLHGIEDVPAQLAFNKFVLGGYRMKLTRRECLRSALRLHNETINIW